jgi:curved DNA-binding protein CbpA
MSTVNLYDVLNLEHDCTKKDIKKAYRVLVKEYHPDKFGGDAEMFELITHAYNVLRSSDTRNEYDKLYKLSQDIENGHNDLKYQSSQYYENLKSDITAKPKDEKKQSFKKAMMDMDRKHKFNRNDLDDKISSKDTLRRLRDLEQTREHEDIEITHEQIFENGRFSLDKFNAAFDAMHKGPMELVQHSGNPDPFNVVSSLDGNYSSISNYEDIYAENDDVIGADYSSVNINDNKKRKRISKEDVNKLNGTDYTLGHNEIDDDFNKMLENKMMERNNESNSLKDIKHGDFIDDPTCGGYGIFHDLGVNPSKNITWENTEDIKNRYNRLLEMRKTDI